MRIQHNIAAMNSYRNYTANNKSISKNLEKLSSGYRINRAGDDAAGLAISEKMRAQITGLKTAQKNAKDGISLVQTAEGALTEVHSMLNRMFELSEQSSNGTYDNEVDRSNLQKEVSALKTEIDRIADSSNFNGIKLLDGSLSETGSVPTAEGAEVAVVSGAGTLTEVAATANVQTYKFADALTIGGNDGALRISVGLSDGSTRDVDVVLDAAATGAQIKASIAGALSSDDVLSKLFDVTATGDNASAADATEITFTAKQTGTGALTVSTLGFAEMEAANGTGDFVAAASGDIITVGAAGDVSAAPSGLITQTAATNAYDQVNFGADTVTNDDLNGESVTIGDKTYTFATADKLYDVESDEIAVALGNTRNETMKNLSAALKANGVTTAEVDGNNVKIGNTDEIKVAQSVSLETSSAGIETGTAAAVNGTFVADVADGTAGSRELTISYTDTDGRAQQAKVSYTSTAAQDADGAAMVAAINGDENLKTMFKASYDDSTDKITLTALNDKDGVTITGLTSDDTKVTGGITGETAYGAGQTVDFDLTKLKSGDTISVNGQSYQFLKSADVSKADPSATVVLIDENSTAATAEENTVKNFQAALKNNGLDTKVKGTGAAAQLLIESDAKVQAKGGLTLQIGDTAESFNQLNVSVGDMHTKALKIDDIDIGSQPGADAAMAKIKAAINSVSSTRGDLGALQNRLDHTINNLSVMHENIQDAEATIRDTDVAEEMMAYTKNNILVQSAQAMLAQANQLPQGVLQLLG